MDSHHPTGSGTPAPGDAWLTVSDGLLAGVHHALNNRMAAMTAVAQVLESDLPPGHPLGSALSSEVERLERTVSLLRALPRGQGAGPEPVQLGDVLKTVVPLFGLHHAVRDVACEVVEEPGILPLWIEPAALTHALLVLTTVAGWHAQGLRGGKVVVRCAGDAETVTVVVETAGDGDRDAAPDAPYASLGRIRAGDVGPMLAEAGGEVEGGSGPDGGWRATVRLLTLPAARRREAAPGTS